MRVLIPSPLPVLSRAQRQAFHRLLKHLQRQRGRIVRHLVAGPEHAQEAEVVLRLERAAGRAVDLVAVQRLGFEAGLAGERHRFGRGLVADPVADVVGVSGPLEWEC